MYTINSAQPTAGTNFTSFTNAATRLNTEGVSGPVTTTVAGSPCTEQFLLNNIAGTSAASAATVLVVVTPPTGAAVGTLSTSNTLLLQSGSLNGSYTILSVVAARRPSRRPWL